MEIPEFSSNTARTKPLCQNSPIPPSVFLVLRPVTDSKTDTGGATAAVITRRAGNVDNLAVGVRCRRLARARSVDACRQSGSRCDRDVIVRDVIVDRNRHRLVVVGDHQRRPRRRLLLGRQLATTTVVRLLLATRSGQLYDRRRQLYTYDCRGQVVRLLFATRPESCTTVARQLQDFLRLDLDSCTTVVCDSVRARSCRSRRRRGDVGRTPRRRWRRAAGRRRPRTRRRRR